MPTPENARLAVLIDADNTSPKHAEALLEEVAKYGVPTVKRAYGDWTTNNLSGWLKKVAELAIQPMLQVAHTTGKNSSDSALIIDAMDLLYSDNVDAFALVSSDSDFTSLAIRLRGSGRTVYGLGLRKTPKSLRQAVDRFIYLEDLHETLAIEDAPSSDAPAAGEQVEREVPDLRGLLDRAVKATVNDDGWASLSSVANHITRVEPSFSVKDYGASKLIDLVRSQSYMEVAQPDNGSARVRQAPTRTAKKAARAPARGAARETAKAPEAEPVDEPVDEPVKKSVAKKSGVTTRTRTRSTANSATKKADAAPSA